MRIGRWAFVSFVLLCCSICWNRAGAADHVTAEERLVGGTFKNLARAYVATADLEDLKKKNVHRIKVMRPDWFRMKYAEVYSVARALPEKIRTKYGLAEQISKDDAIRILKTMDKPRIYEIIDNLPDQAIARKFVSRPPDGPTPKSSEGLVAGVRHAWDELLAGLNKPPHKPAAKKKAE